MQLIHARWDVIPPQAWPQSSEAWLAEANRRSDAIDAGEISLAPWDEVSPELVDRPDSMVEVVIASPAEVEYVDELCWYAERSLRAAERFPS